MIKRNSNVSNQKAFCFTVTKTYLQSSTKLLRATSKSPSPSVVLLSVVKWLVVNAC